VFLRLPVVCFSRAPDDLTFVHIQWGIEKEERIEMEKDELMS